MQPDDEVLARHHNGQLRCGRCTQRWQIYAVGSVIDVKPGWRWVVSSDTWEPTRDHVDARQRDADTLSTQPDNLEAARRFVEDRYQGRPSKQREQRQAQVADDVLFESAFETGESGADASPPAHSHEDMKSISESYSYAPQTDDLPERSFRLPLRIKCSRAICNCVNLALPQD